MKIDVDEVEDDGLKRLAYLDLDSTLPRVSAPTDFSASEEPPLVRPELPGWLRLLLPCILAAVAAGAYASI